MQKSFTEIEKKIQKKFKKNCKKSLKYLIKNNKGCIFIMFLQIKLKECSV